MINRSPVGHVCLDRYGFSTILLDLLHRLLAERHSPGRHDNRCAFLAKPKSNGLADPTATTGDNCDLVG